MPDTDRETINIAYGGSQDGRQDEYQAASGGSQLVVTPALRASASRVVAASTGYVARSTMGVAPTMGALGAGFGASTIPSVVRTSDSPLFPLLPTDARLRYTGPMRQPGGNVFNGLTGAWSSNDVLFDGGDGWGVSFTANTRYVEWSINTDVLTNNAEYMQMRVNGQWAQASDYQLFSSALSTPQYRRFDFGTAALRTFEFMFGSGGKPVGFNLDNGVSPSLPALPASDVTAWFFGDSYTAGWGQAGVRNTVAQTFGEIMGVRDQVSFGRGGQGYALNVDGRNIAQRIALDINRLGYSPDIIYLYGSVNDAGQSAATAGANIAAAIQTIQAAHPNTWIVFFTGFKATNGNTDTAHFNAYKLGAESVADFRTLVIDTSDFAIVTGGDNTHPESPWIATHTALMKSRSNAAITARAGL